MPDAKDFAPNNPVYQKESPQPKYKTVWFFGDLQDDREDWYSYRFVGNYYEHDNMIRIVEACVHSAMCPVIAQEEIQNILRIDIREELNTDLSIIFESKVEFKIAMESLTLEELNLLEEWYQELRLRPQGITSVDKALYDKIKQAIADKEFEEKRLQF